MAKKTVKDAARDLLGDFLGEHSLELFNIEFVSDTRSERNYHGIELIVSVNLVGSCLFDVQHFTPKRKYSLEAAVASLRCRTACRVTLDKEQFTFLGILA